MKRSVSEYLSRGGTSLVTPKGMGDLLPPEAAERRALSRSVLRSFELAGYELVTPPVFEHADVVARGNDSVEDRDLLRFVEPESGEVAVLRPDITPQVARIVATQLPDRPPPYRLCYEGRVFRRRSGRARSHRQITQAGLECIGLPGVAADTEVVSLAARALESVGLQEFRIELSDIRLVRSLLLQVPDEARASATAAVAQKDGALLETILHNAGAGKTIGRRLCSLIDAYGDRAVLRDARRRFRWDVAKDALDGLAALTDRLEALGLSERIGFDLADTRGLAYYTGVHFTLLAHGPGEALGAGGRYDNLLSNFEMDAPATGFALDLRNLQWTLRNAGIAGPNDHPLRLVVGGGGSAALDVCDRLRAAGIVAATLETTNAKACLAFARAWGYDAALVLSRGKARLTRASDDSTHGLGAGDLADPERVRTLCRG
ncbi:MAG: ATP phosphoribosyltransferase regulatory subunit [Myxococcales bacterium]|nr:ATP phosphoribosyltransferase regulatory subunit [Myxococcales bacterium]